MAIVESKQEVQIVRIAGGRFKEARELCGFTMQETCRAVGLNLKQLVQLEKGANMPRLGLRHVLKASRFFDVSVDYLFGLSDDWELDPAAQAQREFGAGMHQRHVDQVAKAVQKMSLQQRQIEALAESVSDMFNDLEQIEDSLNRFAELNKNFIDMRGGSALVLKVSTARSRIAIIRRQMIRAKLIPITELEKSED